MSCENLRELLDRISRRLGVDLQLDKDNFCLVQIDTGFDLSLEYEERRDSLLMTAECGELPAADRQLDVMRMLLEANYYGAGTGGAILSINSKTGVIYLQYRVTTAQLDEELLQRSMQTIVDSAEIWIDRLKQISEARPEGEADADEVPSALTSAPASFIQV